MKCAMNIMVLIYYMINVIWTLKMYLYFLKDINFYLIKSVHFDFLFHYYLNLYYIANPICLLTLESSAKHIK